MVNNTNTQKFNLNTEPRLEQILISLTRETYLPVINMLKQGLSEIDRPSVELLDKYLWLVEGNLNGKPPSIELLRREFPTLNFDNIQMINNIDELTDMVYAFINMKNWRYGSNLLVSLADKNRTQGLTDEDTDSIYKYLAKTTATDNYKSIADKDTFLDLYDKQAKLKGISFLSPELDQLTGGIMPGQICTILGAPGSMKTTYSSNIAYNAMRDGKNILYLSLEEQPLQLLSKWLSRCSLDINKPLPQKDIVQRTLDDKQKKILFDEVFEKFKSYPGKLYIVGEQDLPNYSLSTLEAKFKEIDKLARKETEHGIDLVVVDHIQLLKFAISGLDTISTINMYVSFFRQQSLSWLHEKRNVSIILLSQANREGYSYAQKNNGAYLSQHVAEASEVERASAYIISVYTDAMSQITNQLTLCAVKLRGSALPPSVIPIYEDGSVYQVGEINKTIVDLDDNIVTNDNSKITMDALDSMLGDL